MGFNVLLIKIDGKQEEAIHQEYGVVPTEEQEEFPCSPVCGTSLPQGGYLLYVNDGDQIDHEVGKKLSKQASLIACQVSETAMVSFACGWINGYEKWSVSHDSWKGSSHLDARGELPAEFESIRDRLISEQREQDILEPNSVDYIFDIPVDLFEALGGIRYMCNIEGAGPRPWRVLSRIAPPKRWWQFWRRK